jgi:hypothetical protein
MRHQELSIIMARCNGDRRSQSWNSQVHSYIIGINPRVFSKFSMHGSIIEVINSRCHRTTNACHYFYANMTPERVLDCIPIYRHIPTFRDYPHEHSEDTWYPLYRPNYHIYPYYHTQDTQYDLPIYTYLDTSIVVHSTMHRVTNIRIYNVWW